MITQNSTIKRFPAISARVLSYLMNIEEPENDLKKNGMSNHILLSNTSLLSGSNIHYAPL